ncbi:MAG: HesA/MoeB/ThiF family protein [Candidatus Heimdallarchaeaceae archaeon]
MLSDRELEKYSRQIILPGFDFEGQEKLKQSKVLVVGLGGLGSPILYYLVSAGIGTIGIIDKDKVELSNLNRQILHYETNVGENKVDSAFNKLSKLNEGVKLQKYPIELSNENSAKIFKKYDFVLDASDNFKTKFLVNDQCVKAKIPFTIGGVYRFEGQMMTVLPGKTACYRCIFREEPEPGTYPTTCKDGILGTTSGLFGIIEANEAIKYVVYKDEAILLTNKLLHGDLFYNTFEIFEIEKDGECPTCSKIR